MGIIIAICIVAYLLIAVSAVGIYLYTAKQKKFKAEREAEEKRRAKEAADREAARIQREQYEREMTLLMEERKKKEEECKAREKAEAEERAKREEAERLAAEEAWKKQKEELEKKDREFKRKAHDRWVKNSKPDRFGVVNGTRIGKRYFLLIRDMQTKLYSVIATTKEEYNEYDSLINFKDSCQCLLQANKNDYRVKTVWTSEWEYIF